MWGRVTSKTVLRIGYKSLKTEYGGLKINGLDVGSTMSAKSNYEEKPFAKIRLLIQIAVIFIGFLLVVL